ncbi:hypothetical protein SLS61_004612 [Didymella pomorum]
MPLRSPEYMAENLAAHLLAITISLTALALITVVARFWVRIVILKTFGWDDVMMTISAILIIFAYSFIKLSIGFFLLRLADRTKWRPFLIGMLTFIGIFTIGSTFAIIFQCTPVAAGWDYTLRPPIGTGKCYDATIFKNVGVFNSSVNIFTDLLFALIPIPMVWRLQVNLQTRIGLAVILSLGLFASAIAIYKTPMQANFFKEQDWSGHGSWYYIWQQYVASNRLQGSYILACELAELCGVVLLTVYNRVEMNVGIIAANLPTLKPLFANFFGHMRTLTKGRSTGSRSTPLSGPFKSNGYYRQNDSSTGERSGTMGGSYAMRDISAGSNEPQKKDSYDEILVLGKESYGVDGGRIRRQSRTRGSDESSLGREHDVPTSPNGPLSATPLSPRGQGLARNLTIVKTTEVRVSKSYGQAL